MDKDKKEWEKKAKCVYVPPKVEVYEAAPNHLMGTSFIGEAGGGVNKDDDRSEHERGLDGGVEYGAKAVILGQEFSFSDLWEE